MTPKEKAKELTERFLFPITQRFAEQNEIISKRYSNAAKECALICVDEIIEELKRYTDPDSLGVLYWNDVKKEIEKL